MIANKNKALPCFFYFLTFIFLFLLSRSVHLMPGGDDQMFLHILSGKELLPLLYQRYHEWSGRLPIEALLISTIKIKSFWKILIPLSVLLVSFTMWKTFFNDHLKGYIAIPMSLALFMIITPSVNADASWWVTGFYNYLLPLSLGCWSLLIFKNSATTPSLLKIIAMSTLSLTCFSEQIALLMIIGTCSVYWFKTNKTKYDVLFIIITIILTALLLTAPGNSGRFAFEVKNSMPEFGEYNLINKLTLGVDRINHHVNDQSNLIINIIYVMCLCNVLKNSILSKIDFIASTFIAIKLMGFLLSFLDSGLVDIIYNRNYISASSWFGYKIYTSYFFTLASIFSLTYLSYKYISSRKNATATVIFILSGCATVMMIGFSPTVYASAQRVLFTFEICFLATLCLYMKQLFFTNAHTDHFKRHMV